LHGPPLTSTSKVELSNITKSTNRTRSTSKIKLRTKVKLTSKVKLAFRVKLTSNIIFISKSGLTSIFKSTSKLVACRVTYSENC